MSHIRRMVLAAGPPIIIAVAYLVSFARPTPGERAHALKLTSAGDRFARERAMHEHSLLTMCGHTASALAPKLPEGLRIIIRPPFVIAGDADDDTLERAYRENILPIASALWRTYFDRRPLLPVTIILLSNEQMFHTVARRLDTDNVRSYDGYYQRASRRMVLDFSTGTGTLAHELCHALAEFDCPDLPEWFDEGLASLHEETRFSDDGLQLRGLTNWRLRVIREAWAAQDLEPIEQLLMRPSFRSHREGLSYAHAQALCLYLQERDLLPAFYRKLKANLRNDPSGTNTLCELLGIPDCESLDRDFVAWLKRQP